MQSHLFPYRVIRLQKLRAGHGLSCKLDLEQMTVIWHRFCFLAAVCFQDFAEAIHSIWELRRWEGWRAQMPSQWLKGVLVIPVMNANTKCIVVSSMFYSSSLNVFKWIILTRRAYLLGKFRLHWPGHQCGKPSVGPRVLHATSPTSEMQTQGPCWTRWFLAL